MKSRVRPRAAATFNTGFLAGAVAVTAGVSGIVADAADAYTAQRYCNQVVYHSRSTCHGGTYQHKYTNNSAVALNPANNQPAIHGGRPIVSLIASNGRRYDTFAPSGSWIVVSPQRSATYNKTAFCGPYSTNAHLSCTGLY